MSLIAGYSSSEDEAPEKIAQDAFSLSSIRLAKKPRTEDATVSLKPTTAAPDVLTEVRFNSVSYSAGTDQGIGPPASHLPRDASHRYSNERQHPLQRHDAAGARPREPVRRPQPAPQPKRALGPRRGAIDDGARLPRSTPHALHPWLFC